MNEEMMMNGAGNGPGANMAQQNAQMLQEIGQIVVENNQMLQEIGQMIAQAIGGSQEEAVAAAQAQGQMDGSEMQAPTNEEALRREAMMRLAQRGA